MHMDTYLCICISVGGGGGGVTSHLASDRSWRGRLKALRGFVVCFFPLFFHEQRWLLLTQILESQYMYILCSTMIHSTVYSTVYIYDVNVTIH
jgi:hypothetical protein